MIIYVEEMTPVRVWVLRKIWRKTQHGNCWSQEAPRKVFDGKFGELCQQFPLARVSFEPADSGQERLTYYFEVLTPNGGWKQTNDPRLAMPMS